MSFPKYEEYRDSGDELLGIVPANWNVVRLKRIIAAVESGTSVNATDDPAGENEIGVLKTSAVYTGEFRASENKKVDVNELDRVSCPLKPSSLIVSRMNTPDLIGAAGYVEHAPSNLYLPDRLWQVTFNGSLTKFVHYWTLTSSYRHQVKASCTGTSSSMKNLTQEQFGRFQLTAPPLEEQQAIASFLDAETAKIDALVAEQRRLIELLQEKRQAVISHAVTKGLDPHVRMKPSGIEWLGDVPEHWEVVKLKLLTQIGNGSTPDRKNAHYWDNGIYPWLNSSVVNQSEVTKADQFVTQVALDECHLPKITPPAVLVGITGQGRTRGMATILQFEATINQHLAYLKPRENRTSVSYIHRFFQKAYWNIREESDGTGSTKGAITCGQLEKLKMPLPPNAEQRDIIEYLDTSIAKIELLSEEAERAITLLQERRTALISAAVTGKIDVRQFACLETS
ncbi:restriction endonuclease subunit S [Blastopirellula sp. J2-11]|uniref:restriction endonuclease subunit S n=1 Tax=Blastopirellula sp. J2-11 TaxID=2943192 RepID=UPI0021C78228|nr:restriction endonuclease subunit S [Blastopirellula sp. J2-11]UUO09028.1 restriction endonuclease subunit S [Blastopirellula sp. J2-11]